MNDLDDYKVKRKVQREETDEYKSIKAKIDAALADDELETQRIEQKIMEIEKEIARQESFEIMDYQINNDDNEKIPGDYRILDDNSTGLNHILLVTVIISVIINIGFSWSNSNQKTNGSGNYKQVSIESESEY